MKHQWIYIIMLLLLLPGKTEGQAIRIIPQKISVHNDSIHIALSMDLNSVKPGSLTALTFTPVLTDPTHRLPLSPVVVSGTQRSRYEQRERALSDKAAPAPYRIIRGNMSGQVGYKVTVPYASWMAHAALLLTQEIKDCCDLRLLATDTLTGNLALGSDHTPSPTPHRARKPRRTSVTLSGETLAGCIPMVSYLTPLPKKNGKQRSDKTTLYIDYPLNKYDIFPDFRNNRQELGKIDSILMPRTGTG